MEHHDDFVKLTVEEAAAQMGVTAQHLRIGLQQRRYPFGAAVKMARRWSYYINAERFAKYMQGELDHEKPDRREVAL